MKFFNRFFLVLLALLFAEVAFADTTATITWTNATTYTDGTPFVSLCCTNIYRATSATAVPVFLVQTKGAIAAYADTGLAPGTYCYTLLTVSSKTGDLPSAQTVPVCKTIGAVPPTPTTKTASPPSSEIVK